MRFAALRLPQSMYSPVRIVDCYSHEKVMSISIMSLKSTYAAELAVALQLNANKEHAAVKEH